jgi:hypothetical protein
MLRGTKEFSSPEWRNIFVCEAVDVVGSSGSRAHFFFILLVCVLLCVSSFSYSSPLQKTKNSDFFAAYMPRRAGSTATALGRQTAPAISLLRFGS